MPRVVVIGTQIKQKRFGAILPPPPLPIFYLGLIVLCLVLIILFLRLVSDIFNAFSGEKLSGKLDLASDH